MPKLYIIAGCNGAGAGFEVEHIFDKLVWNKIKQYDYPNK
jgi:hypothetical protein